MIPIDTNLTEELEEETMPSNTYKMNTDTINGNVDMLDAVVQASYKILATERYNTPIYSWDYGLETADLVGKPRYYVVSEIKRRITEALTQDDRIELVDNFEFSYPSKNVIVCKFCINTIYGSSPLRKEVNY